MLNFWETGKFSSLSRNNVISFSITNKENLHYLLQLNCYNSKYSKKCVLMESTNNNGRSLNDLEIREGQNRSRYRHVSNISNRSNLFIHRFFESVIERRSSGQQQRQRISLGNNLRNNALIRSWKNFQYELKYP